jgi:protein involved in polysaccharide export with SLBB domain
MPMIGGDSIVVTRGRFLVQGWVDRPGLYSFSPGMTAFDAATIAGGALFPADLGSVHVLRARPDGTKKVLSIDLNDVRHGDAHDITLHEGDVVKFDASLWRLAPYSVYWTLKNVISVGAGVGPTM